MIEIPGYRIDRPIGRGGMSTVYLALQESVQREVALKIMSGALLGDEEFGERFLREARIAASLRHPNVVHVYDVAQHGDQHYMAMEHLPGGPVIARRGPRRDFIFALRAVREIASALDYAHKRGVVHRDIKPDNILLREDGSAVLTDFGIARAGDSMRMTRTGAIIGTPHYMSPEQARGQPLDGRADLYSLGVVFYQLLMGEVPYQAEDSVAVGIMHITAPLPRLPASLAELQALFDRLLAKDPAQRFQTGAELIEALDGIAHLRPELPDAPAPRGRRPPAAVVDSPPTVVTPPEARAARAPKPSDGPSLGQMEGIVTGEQPRRRELAASKPRARRPWPWLLLPLALLVLALVFETQLRELWSGSDRAEQLTRAEAALAAGRLQDDAEGPGARSLYNAILAAEPDHEAAREGLRRVGRAHLEAARGLLERSDLLAAQRELELARALGAGSADIAALSRQIEESQGRSAGEQELSRRIEAAAAALAAGLIEEPGVGAIALYQQALALAPDNPVARAGLRAALAPLIASARSDIETAAFDAAEQRLAIVSQADPGHLDLPELRAALAESRKGRAERIAALLQQARERTARGQLTTPVGRSAQDAYREALALDPALAEASEGLRRLGRELLRRAEAASADFDFEAAESALDAAALLDPPPAGLPRARERMEAARQSYARVAEGRGADPSRVDALIAEAEVAIAQGRLLQPPGESAYDSLRAALALAPSDARARALLQGLPAQARQRFDAALAASRPNDALRYLEGLQVVAPTSAELPLMRQRLAVAYLGLANERLGRGELASARQALERAAELEPNHIEIPALRARLEQAGG
ncbi:serine/threonine-protein kinase [Aquimonas voraii]|uniref:non-specific serine/threonine protein kinase n=1 Tax=Aquimonas voraii TaxID=265719 RepID=A0A1G6UK93_9GAMM|nr:serine/threonine-protein kinase [Aquimonas voraii]SDD41689.1 Serine/threonine protein kinase [Aquimonas voraii]